MPSCTQVKLNTYAAPAAPCPLKIVLGASQSLRANPTTIQTLNIGTLSIRGGPVGLYAGGNTYVAYGTLSVTVKAFVPSGNDYNINPNNVVLALKAKVTPTTPCPVVVGLSSKRQIVTLGLGYSYPMAQSYVFTQMQQAPRLYVSGFTQTAYGSPSIRGGSRTLTLTGVYQQSFGVTTVFLHTRRLYFVGADYGSYGTLAIRLHHRPLLLPSIGAVTTLGTPTIRNKRQTLQLTGVNQAVVSALSIANKRRYVYPSGTSYAAVSNVYVQYGTRRVYMVGKPTSNTFGTLSVVMRRQYVNVAGATMTQYGSLFIASFIRRVYLSGMPSSVQFGTMAYVPGHNVLRLGTVPMTETVSSVSVRLHIQYVRPTSLLPTYIGAPTIVNRNVYVHFSGIYQQSMGTLQVVKRTGVLPTSIASLVGPQNPVITFKNRYLQLPSVGDTNSVPSPTLRNRLTIVSLTAISQGAAPSFTLLALRVRRVSPPAVNQWVCSPLIIADRAHHVTFTGLDPSVVSPIRTGRNPPVIEPTGIDLQQVSIPTVSLLHRRVEPYTIVEDAFMLTHAEFRYAFTQTVQPTGIPYPNSHWVFDTRPVFDPNNGVWTTHLVPSSTYQDFADGTLAYDGISIVRQGHTFSFPNALQTIDLDTVGDTSFVSGSSYPDPYIDENGNWVLPKQTRTLLLTSIVPPDMPQVDVRFPNRIMAKAIQPPQLPLVAITNKNRVVTVQGFEGYIQPAVDAWFAAHAMQHPNKLINEYVYPQCEWQDMFGVYRFTYWHEWLYTHDQVGRVVVAPTPVAPSTLDTLRFGLPYISRTPIDCSPGTIPPPRWLDPLVDYTTFELALAAREKVIYQDASTPTRAVVSAVGVQHV